MIALSVEFLTKDDRIAIIHNLRDFVIRVASDTDNKWPEEVAVLPAIVQLLFQLHFSID